MLLTIGSALALAATAVIFATLGFVTSAVLSASKISGLYQRLDHVETMYEQQVLLLNDMAVMIRQISGQDAAAIPASTMAQLKQLTTRP